MIKYDKLDEYVAIDDTIEHLDILNRKISKQEILKAMGTIKRANAMGCDLIHNVMLNEGKDVLIDRFPY